MSSINPPSSSGSSSSLRKRRGKTLLRNGRAYLDGFRPAAAYPLPIDLPETHRQIIFAQLTDTIFGSSILAKELLGDDKDDDESDNTNAAGDADSGHAEANTDKRPIRVLELGCDTGWWSASCHQHFQAQGHRVEFVGLDLKPPVEEGNYYRTLGMNWEYIQHDINDTPWPIPDGTFDLVMARNLTLALDASKYSHHVQEYVRVLKPGGTLELWEHDYTIRSMAPAILQAPSKHKRLEALGLYPVEDSQHFKPAHNPCVAEFNTWITAALAERKLPTMPCSYIEAMFEGHLVEGCEELEMQRTRRIAVPLSTAGINWEREGEEPRILTPVQEVIRTTALESFIGMVEAYEPLLRTASGQSQVSWEAWIAKARKQWLSEAGFSLGECLEMGAWSLKKTSPSTD
ncbi:S-adenosyl-L-methionine-dependent methyltransferase [Coniella lustricola]|uniref:S-adenosyl-L-methionine-dependent methyltransferase n=1 Tax=Coniella lustricola TaxID=2025994 RepID=A0A2T3AHR0_9PEZI|nr:S-adenosyl-L-methionine-dependent methyltransferase [Coniella lustricola]